MAVSEVPRQYETSDGRAFAEKKEAERHEALLEARARFEEARRQLGFRLLEDEKTADGARFRVGGFQQYWHVAPGYFNMPRLQRVSYLGHNLEFEEREDGLLIRQWEAHPDSRKNEGEYRTYRLRELYAHEENAERALLAAQEAWLAERTAEVDALRSRLRVEDAP